MRDAARGEAGSESKKKQWCDTEKVFNEQAGLGLGQPNWEHSRHSDMGGHAEFPNRELEGLFHTSVLRGIPQQAPGDSATAEMMTVIQDHGRVQSVRGSS